MNKYKLTSYFVLSMFFILSTIQTLFDMQFNLNINLSFNQYIFSVLFSFIPIILIIFITNIIKNKTKYSNLFVIPEIKHIIKFMFYTTLLFIFVTWSFMLISIIILLYDKTIIFLSFFNFFLTKIVYIFIYVIIISIFFNSISKSG